MTTTISVPGIDAPVNTRALLYALYWEDLEDGRWSNPGHDLDDPHYEDGGYTTDEALASSAEFMKMLGESDRPVPKSLLTDAVERYTRLCQEGVQ